MNAKKAKALRRMAKQLAERHSIQTEDQHLINRRTRVIIVGNCERGVLQRLKRGVRQGTITLKKVD
jgi:hypothetical protein